MITIAHIINPVSANDNADLFEIQKTTIQSIINAKNYASRKIDIALHTAQYEDAIGCIPNDFKINNNLERTVCDVHTFTKKRKLPLIKDILDNLYKHTKADYLIYTNTDIALMPFFYETVAEYINQGYDAFIINRRRILNAFENKEQLNSMYAEVGKTHTGYDTFVFKRSLYEKFILKDMCVGVPHVGNDLFYNIFCFAEKPKLFTDKHLTFHVGMELYKEWAEKEYVDFNKQELNNLIKELKPKLSIEKFPGSELSFLSRHFKWLMNPTFHYPTMLSLDIKQVGRKRNKTREVERKSLKQKYLNWLVKHINFD